ncbi:MAG: hypothetical protein HYY45_21535, partial [Deltaproteobacteria bacterium]|nr:hypothetical protein [Deltaproteobacteria bacterium]
ERILKPLPEYDPFDKPAPAPQFFPDEVDKRVREALVDSLTNRHEALEDHVRFLTKKDAELKKERGTVTGLARHVVDLFHNTIPDRERYLEAQKKSLASSLSPEEKKLIESRLRNDDLTQAEELLSAHSANKWGGMLNRLLSSVDLVSILSGSYIGAAVDSAVSQLLALGPSEMSLEERKALTRYLEHLKRYPDDPKNGGVQKQVEALEKKKRASLVQKQVEKAEEAAQKRDWDNALFHYEMATFIDPSSRPAEEGLEKARKSSRQKEEEKKKGLSVTTAQVPDNANPQQGRELTALLDALTLRDHEQIEAETKRLAAENLGFLPDSAKDASAVALEIKGQHEEAKKILQQIARSSNDPYAKRRAELLLSSREYNLLASFNEARSQHRLETVKYVLLGEDLLKKNLLYGTAPLIVSGPAGAASLAAANAIMIGTNLFQVLTANPISYQSVIDKGVDYIRNHPESAGATEVYAVLADAYEEIGMYDKAVAYHEMSGKATEKKLTDLKEKSAKALLQAAEKNSSRSAKEAYLKSILDDYPESTAAKEATQKLAALMKVENQGLSMSKTFLMENPELYGPGGLRLKATLFDGNLSNMELADKGINLLSDQELLLHLQSPWGVQSQSYLINKEVSERLQTALRNKNYEVAMGDVDARSKGSPGGIKNLPLPLLRGELGKKGSESDDTTLSLLREATGSVSAFPKVLDHKLLSESEKEGATKWKLPPIQGSISASGFDLSGSFPAGLWGDRLSVGTDQKSPFAGLQLPIPMLQGFIPVDFLLQGRPGRFSIFPKIHMQKSKDDDQELYR